MYTWNSVGGGTGRTGTLGPPSVWDRRHLRVAAKLATSQNLAIKSTMSPYRTLISTFGPHLMGRLASRLITYRQATLQHTCGRYLRGADCYTGNYLVVAKVRDRLSVSKHTEQKV
jgi:hypothetical protein